MPANLRPCTEGDEGRYSALPASKAIEEFKVNGKYVDAPEKGVDEDPFVDAYIEASLDYLDKGLEMR